MPPTTPEPSATHTLGPIRSCSDEDLGSTFDIAIVGGGIYGVCALLEASRRGAKAVLLEAGDFGGGVSWSSHRIIHGGLRYLQSLDIARFRESVRERRWFMETFPDAIRPVSCLVPLPGKGTRRASLFACASLMNNALNAAFGGSSPRIRSARVMSNAQFAGSAPGVFPENIRAVGTWQDGLMVSSERVLICMLRLACDIGGRAMRDTRVTGIEMVPEPEKQITLACDHADRGSIGVRAKRIINCAGPSSGSVAQLLGGSHPRLFEPLRAFNVLLDVEPQITEAVALDAPSLDGRMLFVVPGPAGLAIGTWEEAAEGGSTPRMSSVERLIDAAGDVLGRSDLSLDRVSAVWSGLLPRAAGGRLSPSDRPVFVDHGEAGGVEGAFSVSGVKYTTARLVAERAVLAAMPSAGVARSVGPISDPILQADWLTIPPDPGDTEAVVRRIVRDEAAVSVDDICLRRTAWYTSPECLRRSAAAIGAALELDQEASARAVDEALAAARVMRDG
ncbi:MAG: FAD-dependent oxidoreductase [Planctomycetota bacterium]